MMMPARQAPGRIRSRATFEAVAATCRRGRSGPITVRFAERSTWSEPQIGYAISRRVGSAVVRNRLRRRLRAIMLEEAPLLAPGAYVVQVGPNGPALKFDDLKAAMSQALEGATSHRASRRLNSGVATGDGAGR
ncbi:MAG: ribonuclease P protein component [Acidimicrobiales bacterium]